MKNRTYILLHLLSAALAAAVTLPAAAQTHWTDNGVMLADVSTSLTHHAVVEDSQGGFFLAWEDNPSSDADIFLQWFDASGTPQWSSPGVIVTSAAGDQRYPAVAPDGSGGVFVAWQDELSWDIYLQHYDASGTALAAAGGMPVCTAAAEQSAVRLVSDGSGGVILVWYDTRNGSDTDLYAQKVSGSDVPVWTGNGVPVTTASGIQNVHSVMSDGDGGAIVVWQDGRVSDNDDIYAQRIDGQGNPAWTVNGIPLTTAAGDQMDPVATVSGDRIVVSWVSGGNVYAQALDTTGSTLWTGGGVPVCTADGTQNYVSISGDRDGGVLIAWTDNRTWYDIYAQKLDAAGTPQWTANGKAVYSDANNFTQYKPKILEDGAGGAYAVWMDLRSGDSYDLYMQHLSADGSRLYSGNGSALSAKSGLQGRSHLLVPDSSAGAILVWYDKSDGDDKLLAQLLNDNIDVTLPAEGQILPGGVSATVGWSFRNDRTAFDHLRISIEDTTGAVNTVIIQDDIDPGDTDVSWTPASFSSSSARIRLESLTASDSVVCSFTGPVFTVDTDPPAAFSLVSPQQSALTGTVPSFSWRSAPDTQSEPVTYELWIDGALVQGGLSDTTWTLTPAQELAAGEHTWYVVAVDQAQQSRQSSEMLTFTAAVDTNPPLPFSLSSPADNFWTADSVLTFSWESTSDQESGLAKYVLLLDGVVWTDNIPPGQTSVTAPAITVGAHSWNVMAVDSLENTRLATARTLHIDYVPPQPFSLLGPASGSWRKSGALTFTWQAAADTGSGLSRYQLLINGTVKKADISPDSLQYTLAGGGTLPEGLHTWTIRAEDELGNIRSASAPFTLGVDGTSPSPFAGILPGADSLIASVTPSFSWQASSDARSGIHFYQLWIDGSLNRDNIGTTLTPVSGTLGEGAHTWFVRAVDNAGNTTDSTPLSFTADTTGPVIPALLTPAEGTVLHTDKPLFSWRRPADALSGISHVLLFINGQTVTGNLAEGDTTFTPSASYANGSHHWKLRVYDSAGNMTQSESVYFSIDCHHPQLTSPAAVTATEDVPFSYTAAWTDDDNDEVEITFLDVPSWLSVNGITLSGTPLNSAADTLFRIIAADPVYRDTFTVSIHVQATDDRPSITPIPGRTVSEDQLLDGVEFTVSDEETAPELLTVDIASDNPGLIPPDSVTVSGTGSLRSLTIRPVHNGYGSAVLTVSVSDGAGRDSCSFICTVTPVNDPPGLSPVADQTCKEDSSITGIACTVSDIETGAAQLQVTVSAADTSLITPSGIVISGSGSSRFISLTPVPDANGRTDITVSVSDGALDSTITFALTVLPVNDRPRITSPAVVTIDEKQDLIYSASAVDADNDNLYFTYTGIPAWLSPSGIDIAGYVPNDAEDTSFFLIVDDGTLCDSLRVSIFVNRTNDPPCFVTPFPEGILRDIDTLAYSIILDDYIDDPDDHDSTLVWTWQYLDSYPVTVDVTGNPQRASIYGPHFLGVMRVLFTATDPHGAAVSDTLKITSVTTDVPENGGSAVPDDYVLYRNYPNPFNPETTIRFGLPRNCRIRITVYNMRGQEIAVLADRSMPAGIHEVTWDASAHPSGIYIYRIHAEAWSKTGRMLLLK
ncbi:T9SS type A sorting domain-containing protein [bacterium]|nr:T9SS type A sorting domain-containing protein [bacterium]